MAFIALITSIAPGFMPLAGGLLHEWGGWRMPFLLVFVLGTGLLAWCAMFLAEPARERSASMRPSVVIAGYRSLLGRAAWLWPSILVAMPSLGIFAWFVGAPLLFMDTIGIAPSQYGLIPAVGVFAVMAGTATSGRWVRRVAPATVMGVGAAVMVAGGLLTAVVLFVGVMEVFVILPSAMVYMFGMGLVMPAAGGFAMQSITPREAGSANALAGAIQCPVLQPARSSPAP